MKRLFYRLTIASLFIVAVQFLGSLPAIAAAPSSKLIIGYASISPRVVPLWVAREQGYLAKYGVDAETIYIRGGTILVAGLASGDVQVGRTAGAAILSAVAGGQDFKILSTFSSRNTYDVVVRPSIKQVEDLRGKKIAINSLGGGTWMGAMLWLEHFGLDAQRDHILLQSIGDQAMQSQALESGIVDVAMVDSVYSKWLKQKGMMILADYSELKQSAVSQSTVVPRVILQQRADVIENYLKAEIEGLAFSVAPKNKPAVIKMLMKRLRIDAAGAEDGYVDLLRGVDRRPLASLEGMRNLQRLLKPRNPKIGEVKIDEVVDNRIMRKLDESGFIDRAYAAQGVSIK
jgi:ABC-type nitrate/sulfonate/bicarbonate transport system substrate-binding protein